MIHGFPFPKRLLLACLTACGALASVQAADPVVSTLAELIDDPDPEVRAGALRALASVRSQREVLVPRLEAALRDPALPVRRPGASGLVALGAVAKIGIPD